MNPEDGSQVRENIIQQATKLFSRQGYNGVSMREIAAACSLSKAGLYYHFKDKQDLFLAILTENLAVLTELVNKAVLLSGNTRQKISYFAHGIFNDLKEDQSVLMRLASHELRNLSPALYETFSKEYYQGFIEPVRVILSDGMQQGELRQINPHTATWALLGLLYPYLDMKVDPDQRRQMIDDVLQIYFEGVAWREG